MKTPKVTYGYSRLCFLAEMIEPLRMDDSFQVNCPEGAFRMTKRQFHATFGNVVRSRSYQARGNYNYPTIPRKALQYLVDEGSGRPIERALRRYQYNLPPFLEGTSCNRAKYVRWLSAKAAAHKRRDQRRGNRTATYLSYKFAIHQAVLNGGDRDAYTGKPLDWTLISKYDNELSRRYGRKYKKKFANLPTVDHVGDGLGSPDFKICSWKINDCKSDLSLAEFVQVCKEIIKHNS